MSPNQVAAAKAFCQRGSDRDISRVLERNTKDRAQADQQVEEHTQRAYAALTELSDKVKEAQAGRLSTDELASLRRELLKFANFIDGADVPQKPNVDGTKQLPAGVRAVYDRHYEQLDRIEAAPGEHIDAVWEKWGSSLQRNRFQVDD